MELKLPRYLNLTDSNPPTDFAHVRRMEKIARKLLNKFTLKKRYKNFYLDFHRELNSLQENDYIDFANKRWSINSFLGYKQLVNAAAIANENEGEN